MRTAIAATLAASCAPIGVLLASVICLALGFGPGAKVIATPLFVGIALLWIAGSLAVASYIDQ